MLGINDDPVTIKAVEVAIVERAFEEGWVGGGSRPKSGPERR